MIKFLLLKVWQTRHWYACKKTNRQQKAAPLFAQET
jgi:hypothetical protein